MRAGRWPEGARRGAVRGVGVRLSHQTTNRWLCWGCLEHIALERELSDQLDFAAQNADPTPDGYDFVMPDSDSVIDSVRVGRTSGLSVTRTRGVTRSSGSP